MNSFFASAAESATELGAIEAVFEAMLGFGAIIWLVIVALCVIALIANVKIFMKAGIAGWKALIPFYNTYLMYKLVFGNGWLFLLNFLPLVGYILPCVLAFKLAKVFDKDTGFAILSIFFSPITHLILAFGDSKYNGPLCEQRMGC